MLSGDNYISSAENAVLFNFVHEHIFELFKIKKQQLCKPKAQSVYDECAVILFHLPINHWDFFIPL